MRAIELAAAMGQRPSRPSQRIMVRCPAHEDRHPSLSLADGRKAILFKCFAGCDRRAILSALFSRYGIELAAAQAPESAHRSDRRSVRSGPDRDLTDLLPIPEGLRPGFLTAREIGRRPNDFWIYRSSSGAILGYCCRFDRKDGGKDFCILRAFRDRSGRILWKKRAFPKPAPLYGLEGLKAHPERAVLIVEGEKTALAARRLFPERLAMTSPGGANAAHLADWSPLAGRDIVLSPDMDRPGLAYVAQIVTALSPYRPSRLRLLRWPARWRPEGDRFVIRPAIPKGYDLADAEAEGWTAQRLQAFLRGPGREYLLHADIDPLSP